MSSNGSNRVIGGAGATGGGARTTTLVPTTYRGPETSAETRTFRPAAAGTVMLGGRGRAATDYSERATRALHTTVRRSAPVSLMTTTCSLLLTDRFQNGRDKGRTRCYFTLVTNRDTLVVC